MQMREDGGDSIHVSLYSYLEIAVFAFVLFAVLPQCRDARGFSRLFGCRHVCVVACVVVQDAACLAEGG